MLTSWSSSEPVEAWGIPIERMVAALNESPVSPSTCSTASRLASASYATFAVNEPVMVFEPLEAPVVATVVTLIVPETVVDVRAVTWMVPLPPMPGAACQLEETPPVVSL